MKQTTKAQRRFLAWLKETDPIFKNGWIPLYSVPFTVQARTISRMKTQGLIETRSGFVKLRKQTTKGGDEA